MRTIDAILFDLDGTLVNTEDLHLRAWRDVVLHYGHQLPEGWKHSYIGNPDIDWARHCAAKYPGLPRAEDLLVERHRRYRSLLREHGSRCAFPGLDKMLSRLASYGFKMAIGTNSPMENTVDALSLCGIAGYFPVVVAYGMTPRGKPFPDIYRAAMDGLGVSADRSVVIEDSVPGIEAGRAAGALVLGVATTYPSSALSQADMVFSDTLSALCWVIDNCRPGLYGLTDHA